MNFIIFNIFNDSRFKDKLDFRLGSEGNWNYSDWKKKPCHLNAYWL